MNRTPVRRLPGCPLALQYKPRRAAPRSSNHRPLTQAELLAEAAKTEIENTKSLEVGAASWGCAWQRARACHNSRPVPQLHGWGAAGALSARSRRGWCCKLVLQARGRGGVNAHRQGTDGAGLSSGCYRRLHPPQLLVLIEEETKKKAQVVKRRYAGPMVRWKSRRIGECEAVSGQPAGPLGIIQSHGCLTWQAGRACRGCAVRQCRARPAKLSQPL